ncbi:MAG: N-acetylmuramoyl-L-alanine amidase [Thermoplasmatota archaeon]
MRGLLSGILALAVLFALAPPAAAVDYPGAAWHPAASCNYTASTRETTYDIRWIVIHVAEGSYNATWEWFQDCAAAASAHFVVAQDGRVAQMVLAKDVAWHAGNWAYNTHSIGIEHEGYTDQASTWTDAMYRASAALTRAMADAYGVPLVHPTGIQPADPMSVAGGIIGHDQVPDPNDPTKGGGAGHHTDPGQYFDWNYFMSLVVGNTFNVRVTSPANGAWVGGKAVAVASTTNEEGSLAWLRYLVDGNVAAWATAAPHAWTMDSTTLADGAHALAAQAENTAGTTASGSVVVNIDNTPPNVRVVTPAANALTANNFVVEFPKVVGKTFVSGTVNVTADATDPQPGSGVARVVFSVDRVQRATATSAPYSWTWRAGDEKLGPHTLTVTAIDRVGNARSVSEAIDDTFPSTPAGLFASL